MGVLGFSQCQNEPVFTIKPFEGAHLMEIVHPQIIDAIQKSLEHVIRGTARTSDFVNLDNGMRTRVQVITAPFEVQENRFICFFETLMDAVPQSNGAENGQSLAANHNIFYQAFHAAPIPLAIARLVDCCFVEVNDSFVQKSGYAREELQGQCALELGFWRDPKDPGELVFRLNQEQAVRDYEVTFLLRSGEEVQTILNLDLVNIDGEACILICIQDITEIKKTEAKLKENQQLLISINENLNEGIYRSTPEDGFIYVNNAFARMFGMSVQDALKISPEKLYVNEQDRERVKRIFASKGALKNVQVEFRKQNGKTFWGFLSGIRTTDENGNSIYDGAIVDISDIRSSKVLLTQKNNELKKINQELDRFVYSASHDLRAPLTSLLGLVNIALLEVDDPSIVNYLEMMKGSVNKLDSLISDIINFSRNARLGLTPESINFRELVNDSFEHLKYMSESDKIRQEIHIEPHQCFFSDPKRLVILLNNLISNAYRYHDLSKKDPFIKVTVSFYQDQATIEVADNGKGIDPDHIQNIFEMFFRATTDSEGSGLGLYIVKETAEKLHGSVTVSSEFEAGTIFTLVIPNLKDQLTQ